MTPEQIADLAKCYTCMDETQKRAAIVYLLDQLVSLGGGAESDTSLTITGTGGNGFIQLPSQSSAPAFPTTGFRLYADATGRFSWRRQSDGFTCTLDATLTANRAYTLKDATGTIPLLEVANTWSVNGALSAPAVSITGTPITGGSATTTAPLVSIGPGAAGNYNTSGTLLNLNAPSGFAGSPISYQVNGAAPSFYVSSGGSVALAGNLYIGNVSGLDAVLTRVAANIIAQRNGTATQAFRVYNTYTDSSNGEWGTFDWGTTGNVLNIGTAKNGTGTARGLQIQTDGTTRLTISAAGTTAFQQSISVPSASAFAWNGASIMRSSVDGVIRLLNNAETDFGRLQFGGTTSSFPALKRSTTALAVRLADDSADAGITASTGVFSSTVQLAAYTVATLPAAGTAGRRAYVTDATAPTYLGALAGGGAVKCPVFDNGAAWVSC